MRSFINAKISGFRLWIIPEPLVGYIVMLRARNVYYVIYNIDQ